MLIKNFFPIMVLLCTILFWATTFICIKIDLNDLHGVSYTPGALALLRTTVAFFTIFIFFIIGRGRFIWDIKILIRTAILGIVGFGIYNLALNYGELYAPANMFAFIVGQTPIFSAVLAIIFYREHLTKVNVLGIIIGFIGLLIILLNSGIPNINLNFSLSIACIVMICGAIYSVFQKNILTKVTPIELVTYALFFGTFVLLPFSQELCREIKFIPAHITLIAVYSGIFPGAIAYLLWSYVLTQISITKGMSFFYLFPFISCLLGYIFIHEVISFVQFLGAIIALGGALIFNYKTKSTICKNIRAKCC
ncbi:MAG: DMT family transporter [Burkholderiales bacterium]|nr:DMT family transporter [Burkholderiales bacterium]